MHVKFGALSIGLALCLAAGVCLGSSAIQWQPTLERAQILAAHSNRLVLIHFWGNGCPPCEWMEREVFTRPDVAQALDRGFVAVKINKDQSPGDASRFGVAAVPTDVIVTPQGQVLGSYVGRATAPEFVDRLNQVVLRGQPPAGAPYASETWASPAQTAYSQPGAQMQAQPNAAYSLDGPAGGMGQPSLPIPQQGPIADQTATVQAIPQYSQQYGVGPSPSVGYNASPSYNTNFPAAQAGMNPAVDPASRMAAAPVAQAPYANNPQMPSAAAMAQPGFSAQNPAVQMAAAPVAGNPPLALEGFCPVSLERTMRLDSQPKWVPGDPRWGLRHEGRTYLFAGPEQQQAFFENPNFYAPVLSGNDVVLQAEQGVQVPGVREFGARWRDRVYLFSSRESFDKFQANPDFYESQILGSGQTVAGPSRSSAQNAGAAMISPTHGYR